MKGDFSEDNLDSLRQQLIQLRAEKENLTNEIQKRNKEITSLQKSSNELRVCLASMTQANQGAGSLGMFVPRDKKPAVSGEPGQVIIQKALNAKLATYAKDGTAEALIREAVQKNEFLKRTEEGQLREMIACMKPRTYDKGRFIMEQGKPGLELYVIASGRVEVKQEESTLSVLGAGNIIGELALLYNTMRTATVVTCEQTEVWCLERDHFQAIMMRTGQNRQKENERLLKMVKPLQKLPISKLLKVADSVEEETFAKGEYIIRQGWQAESFYIIRSGRVEITQTPGGGSAPKHLRFLMEGEAFGELALLRDDVRSANAIAASQEVKCMVIDRQAFHKLVGNLEQYSNTSSPEEKPSDTPGVLLPQKPQEGDEFANVQLGDLVRIGTLGVGGFGRVELVHTKSNAQRTFALKCLKKKRIEEKRQEEARLQREDDYACNQVPIHREPVPHIPRLALPLLSPRAVPRRRTVVAVA